MRQNIASEPGPECHCHECTNVCHPDVAAHFIGSGSCRFFLHSGDGRHCVSTVGDYRPLGAERTEVGHNRLYETMVFDKTRNRDRWSSLDMRGYNTEEDARLGHAELLAKYCKEKLAQEPSVRDEKASLVEENGRAAKSLG